MILHMDSSSRNSIPVASRSVKAPNCKAKGLGVWPIQSDKTTSNETTASSIPEDPTLSALERPDNPSQDTKAEEKHKFKEKKHARRALRPYFIADWCTERQQSSPSSNSASSDMLAILERRIRAHHMNVHDMESGVAGHGVQRSRNNDSAQDVERPHHASRPPTFDANVTSASEYYDPVHGLKWDERDFAWQWNQDIGRDPRPKPVNEKDLVARQAQNNPLAVIDALSATKLTLPTRKATSLWKTTGLSSPPAVRSYHIAIFEAMQAAKRSIISNNHVVDPQSLGDDIEMQPEGMQLTAPPELWKSVDTSDNAAGIQELNATSQSITKGLPIQNGDGNQPSNMPETPASSSADPLNDAVPASERANSTAEQPALLPPLIQVPDEIGEVSNTARSTASGCSPRSIGSSPMELSINEKRSPIIAETYSFVLEIPSSKDETVRSSAEHSTKVTDTSSTEKEDSDGTATDSVDEISLLEPTTERSSTAEDTPTRQVMGLQPHTVHTPFIPWHPDLIERPDVRATPTPTPRKDRRVQRAQQEQQAQRAPATPTKHLKRSSSFWAKKGVRGIFSSPSLVPPDSNSPSKVDAQFSKNHLNHQHDVAQNDRTSMPDLAMEQEYSEESAKIVHKSTAHHRPLMPEDAAPTSSTADRLTASGQNIAYETKPDPSPAEPSTSLSNRFKPSPSTSRPMEPLYEHQPENRIERGRTATPVPSAITLSSTPSTPMPEPAPAVIENTRSPSPRSSSSSPATTSPIPPPTSPAQLQPASQPQRQPQSKPKRKYKRRITPNPKILANTSPDVTRMASLSTKMEGEVESTEKGKSSSRPRRVSKRVRGESSGTEKGTEKGKGKGKEKEGEGVKKVRRRSGRLSESGGKRD